MTNEDTIKMKMQKAQHDHEIRMAMLNAIAKDPELKYFLGVALGAGITGIGVALGFVGTPDGEGEEEKKENAKPENWMKWIGYAVGPPSWLYPKTTDDGKTSGLLEPMRTAFITGGTGFSGFCIMILTLKAIFGDKGASEILKGIGEIAQGVGEMIPF